MSAELTFYPEPPMRYGTQQGALPAQDLGSVQVDVGGDATAGAAVPEGTRYVVVSTAEDEPCRIAFGGADVEAASSGAGMSRVLKADSEYAFLISAGATHYSLIERG